MCSVLARLVAQREKALGWSCSVSRSKPGWHRHDRSTPRQTFNLCWDSAESDVLQNAVALKFGRVGESS